jgi:p-cumate 2,3-dioxygenase beta subunit
MTLESAMAARFEVEEFLYAESELLDQWRMREWYALFTATGTYEITSPGMPDPEGASPDATLFLVADDMDRLEQRIARLEKTTAYVESPRSITSHLLGNIRIAAIENGTLTVRARFIVHRSKGDETVQFHGHTIYRLERHAETFRIASKRCVLDFNSLAIQGKLAILI